MDPKCLDVLDIVQTELVIGEQNFFKYIFRKDQVQEGNECFSVFHELLIPLVEIDELLFHFVQFGLRLAQLFGLFFQQRNQSLRVERLLLLRLFVRHLFKYL